MLTRLDHFGFLAITGRDASKFLQGYTTCDLDQLNQRDTLPGAICNIQGRMLTSFLASTWGDGLLLRMHRDLVPATMAFLAKYIVFSKAEMADVSEQWVSYGCQDITEEMPNAVVVTLDNTRFEIWTTDRLEASGDVNSWMADEIARGVVWVTPATSETYIPQMFNYHNLGAIDFDKGCYLGQEIVARMQYRGELKRRLFVSEPGVTVAARATDPVSDETGKVLGDVVAAAGGRCLAVLRSTEADVAATMAATSVRFHQCAETPAA